MARDDDVLFPMSPMVPMSALAKKADGQVMAKPGRLSPPELSSLVSPRVCSRHSSALMHRPLLGTAGHHGRTIADLCVPSDTSHNVFAHASGGDQEGPRVLV